MNRKQYKMILGATSIALAAVYAANVQASTVSYTGGTYSQNFDSLPDPGGTSVNTANPVTIGTTTYDLTNPFDFSGTQSATVPGGLGISALSGFSGAGALASKFGATNGDQTTGGTLDFGPNATTPSGVTTGNRALGLIATSTTGATYAGVAIVNNTGAPITQIHTGFTWEFWKQGTLAKTVNFDYTVDNTNALTVVTAATAGTNLSNSPTEATGAVGPVDGTATANQAAFDSGTVTLGTHWPLVALCGSRCSKPTLVEADRALALIISPSTPSASPPPNPQAWACSLSAVWASWLVVVAMLEPLIMNIQL